MRNIDRLALLAALSFILLVLGPAPRPQPSADASDPAEAPRSAQPELFVMRARGGYLCQLLPPKAWSAPPRLLELRDASGRVLAEGSEPPLKVLVPASWTVLQARVVSSEGQESQMRMTR